MENLKSNWFGEVARNCNKGGVVFHEWGVKNEIEKMQYNL